MFAQGEQRKCSLILWFLYKEFRKVSSIVETFSVFAKSFKYD